MCVTILKSNEIHQAAREAFQKENIEEFKKLMILYYNMLGL